MNFLLLLLINIAFHVLMYLIIRHQLQQKYNSKEFLKILEKEANNVITSLNQTTEMNVQIFNYETEKLLKIKEKTKKYIEEMKKLLSLLDRADGRYNEIITNTMKIKSPPLNVKQDSVQSSSEEYRNNKQVVHDEKNETSNTRKHILDLYRQGRSIQEIAIMTRMPIGEVELIIGYFTGND